METGRHMLVAERLERRLLFRAMRFRSRAARAEAATGGRIDRRRDISLKDHALPHALDEGIGNRNRREQRAGIRMARPAVELATRRDLNDLPEGHARAG